MKNSEEFLNFSLKFFNQFFKILQKFFDEYIFAEYLPNHFGDAIAVQDLSGIHILFCPMFPPNQNKIWRRPWFSSCYYYFSWWTFLHSVLIVDKILLCNILHILWYFIFHNILKNQVPPRQNPGAATDKYLYKFKIVLVKKR